MNEPIPTSNDLKKLPHHFQVAFALFCAKQVIHLTDNKEAHECVRLVELWLSGEITSEECKAVVTTSAHGHAAANADAAANAASITADDAAGAIYHATYAAVYAVRAADAGNAHSAAVRAAYAHAADYAALAAEADTHITYAAVGIRKAQWAFYKELLEFDATFEKVVLV